MAGGRGSARKRWGRRLRGDNFHNYDNSICKVAAELLIVFLSQMRNIQPSDFSEHGETSESRSAFRFGGLRTHSSYSGDGITVTYVGWVPEEVKEEQVSVRWPRNRRLSGG